MKPLTVIVIIVLAVMIAKCHSSDDAQTVLNLTNTTPPTTGGNPGGTVVQPPPLPPPPTPTTCYMRQYSPSYHDNVNNINSQTEAYQLQVGTTLCNQKGYSNVFAVMSFPKDQYTTQDQLYYSCWKQVTTTC